MIAELYFMYSHLGHALNKNNGLLSQTVLSLRPYVNQLTPTMNYSQCCSFLPLLPFGFATSHNITFEIRHTSCRQAHRRGEIG